MQLHLTRAQLAVMAIGLGMVLIAVLALAPDLVRYVLGSMVVIVGALIILGAWSTRNKERTG